MGRNKRTKKELPTKAKLKKDPGIPKLPDLKQKKNVEKIRAAQRSAQALKLDPDSPMASEPTLSSLAALAEASEASGRIYDNTVSVSDPSSSTDAAQNYKIQLRRQYIRTLHKVIEESDIVILVLDARDPEGCRSRLVEEEVRRREHEGKRLVFVLNKIDLIPRENAEAWLRYLRHTTPTLPFRASTQQQRTNLASKTSPALLNLLKSYKRSTKSGMGSITVGVVGYPNVGKSSLINSLRRAKVCAVSGEAGFTKDVQAIQVERGVRVLDSPGVVFDDDDQESGNVLLRNAVKVEDMKDPIAVVDLILSKIPPPKLQAIYSLPQFTSTLELLTMLALSTGRLHKGGTPDVLSAARQIIHDFNTHKIPYFTEPPSVHPSSVPSMVSGGTAAKFGFNSVGEGGVVAPGAEDVGSAKIVNEMAPAFDLGGLFSQADAGAFDCEMQDEEVHGGDGVVQMESDDLTPRIPRKRTRSPSPSVSTRVEPGSDLHIDINSDSHPTPPSKRLKRTQNQSVHDNPDTSTSTNDIASQNPLGRRTLKKDAKRARKAARRSARLSANNNRNRAGGEGGMEVDDETGLEFTFMVNSGGVVSP
ncbi:uncharacterized protein FOMMEDRAFT_159288 [Fomitiporia mediterranea MF3/22]|uniref:uncharacterized protein n=1 Tax=Fomitiporia mediterranea (strain MF3/22) TaxID=694068 RepID=UPI0004407E9F|nr:uncharacterized protein FOMMEDRAFT_159288 [Fomitiporia mediterranea MF3/22]EJD00552.1 hypothetical protein FOMMEDRAFT_159288 [Fomitiporia mediterranea MF3/22]